MGFWALWLKNVLFPPLPLLYTSDGELSKEDLAEYSSLVRPYQDEPLAGKDITENEDELHPPYLTTFSAISWQCKKFLFANPMMFSDVTIIV